MNINLGTPPASARDIVTPFTPSSPNRSKAKLTEQSETIIGLSEPELKFGSDQGYYAGFTVSIFDTTTHGDRAIYQLQNTSGSTRKLYNQVILGKPVVQIAGNGGWVWEYSDFDDIDINGERYEEVSNKFIIDPLQAESLGDFYWKYFAPHKQYSIAILGDHPEIEPGDIWTFTISHVIQGVTVESINVDVQVRSVAVERTPRGGQTAVTGVIYDGAWSKTNSTRTRQVGAGRPQWMQNRSNTLVVAASDYVGQADYYCDGTDDDLEIEAALEVLNARGGGLLHLSSGTLVVSDEISIASFNNIIIEGEGQNTIIQSPVDGIVISDSKDIILKNISLEYTGSGTNKGITITTGSENVVAENISIIDFYEGISVGGSSINVQISRNNIIDFISTAIWVNAGCSNIIIEGNDITATQTITSALTNILIIVSYGGNTRITNNVIHDCTISFTNGTGLYCIAINNNEKAVVSNNIISGNTFTYPGTISGYIGSCIVVANSTDVCIGNNVIRDNVFSGNVDGTIYYPHIYIADGSNNTISGNSIQFNTATNTYSARVANSYGIGIRYISASADNNVLSGNIVNANTSDGNNYGIVVGASCNNTVITGNRATGHTSNYTDSGTGTVNSGNNFI